MPQEFLASFAVDIDESGVNRLQQILQQNRDLAEQVSGAFDQAKASMDHFLASLSQDGLSGLMSFLGSNSSSRNPQELATAPAENLSVKDAVKKALVDELQLGDGTERGFALDTLLLSTIAQGTRNASDLRKLPSRADYGLSSASPAFEDSEDYASFQYQASELLRQPIAEAREQMQHALDAEAEGVDPSEYVNKVIEVLREPLQQVQELYDSFSFGEEDSENTGSGFADLTARIDAFLNETAKKKLVLSADASGIVSAVNSAVSQARSIVSNADLTLSVQAESESSGGLGDLVGSLFSGLQLSSGGRFTSPTRAEIAEDGGTEYVIPVNREDRAVPLVRSLLSELSASARESLQDAMAFSHFDPAVRGARDGDPVRGARAIPYSEESPIASALADLSGLMSGAVASAAPVSVISQPVSNQNVSAPVNIRVEASATDPEAVGRSIYDTAERYLLRTLQTVG